MRSSYKAGDYLDYLEEKGLWHSIIVNFLQSHIQTIDFEIISDDVAIVLKWNWDYLEASAFRKLPNEFVYQN